MQLDQSPIIIECDQGSEDWYEARAGVITASQFKHFRADALTKRASADYPAGSYNSEARKIIRVKAFERLSGKVLQGKEFETYAMRRGHELEPAARQTHERRFGVMVDRAGFVMTADKRFGGSADGFIGDDEGCEYKCLVDADEMLGILENDDISSFMDQCQGGMWTTGRKVWNFGLYCPDLAVCGMDFKLIRVPRDDDYINALEADLVKADRAVEALVAKLKNNPLYRAPV